MAYHKSLLNIVTKEVEFIKPSKPTPNSPVLSLSSIDNRTDLSNHSHIVQIYRPTNPYEPQIDPVQVFKEALSKALLYYYPLAGRLVKHSDGKFRVHCSDDGVPFVEAIANNCDLSSVNYLDGENDAEIAKQLVFDLPSHDQNGYQIPLVFKVTKFLCGGFTIGFGLSHAVCDGIGATQFYRTVIELARGESEPSVKPVWEREKLVGSITKQPLPFPIDEASSAVSPFFPTKDLAVLACFKVNSESMKRLKLSLMKECENENFTRFELLTAYVWRSRTRALKQNNDGKTLLNMAVNIRPQLHSPLPEGYYGNAIIELRVVLTVRELDEKPLLEIAKLIRESKKISFSNDYIKKSIDTYETKQDVFDFNVDDMGAIINLAEWNHLGLLKGMDFGGNELVNMLPAPCDNFSTAGVCLFVPPSNIDPSMKGGYRIFVTLPSEAMVKFKEQMEALTL